MPVKVSQIVNQLDQLRTELTDLAHTIHFVINKGKGSEEETKATSMAYKVGQVWNDLYLLNIGIDEGTKGLENKDVDAGTKKIIRDRLARDKAKLEKILKRADRVLKQGGEVLRTLKNSQKPPQESKPTPKEEKKEPTTAKPIKSNPKVKALATDRSQLVQSLLDKLEDKVKAGQRALLRTVLEDFLDGMEKDEAGNIKNTLANKRRFAMFDQVFNRYANDKGLEIVQTLAEGVGRVLNFNTKYFGAFTKPAQLGPIHDNVKETVSTWLGLNQRGNVQPNGYLDTLIKDPSVKNGIKNLLLKSVVSQGGYFDTKKALQEHIEGTPEKTGALQRYYRNFTYDLYSVTDRTASRIFADKLKFNYAIYEGGLVKDSREFCKERNGKVFSREEIAKFDPKEARPPGYDPFTDLGGYACRHHLNWVPDAVAFSLRPDLKNNPPSQPAKEVPPIDPPKPKTAEDMLNDPETKKRLEDVGGFEAWKQFLAKTENYKPNTFYRVEAATGEAGVGKGMYLGRDKKALKKFYDLENEGKAVRTFIGAPKFADLMDYDKFKAFEKLAIKRFGKRGNYLKKLAEAQGFDGIRYYDPQATGEEFVLFNTDKLKEVKK